MKNFEEIHPLENGLFWSAKFHSWNQRTDEIYYVITIFKLNNDEYTPVNRFGIFTYYSGNYVKQDEDLLHTLKVLALKGKTNIPKEVLWGGPGPLKLDEQ